MTRIYLISAAQSEGELYRFAQGQTEGNLSRQGLREISALTERFSNESFDAVYSSDACTAKSTAKALCKKRGLTVCTDKNLREVNLGVWENRNWGNIAFDDPSQIRAFRRDIDAWHVDGAESAQAVRVRMDAAIRRIAQENDGKTIVIVAHPISIRLYLSAFTPPIEGTLQENTAVTTLTWDGSELQVISANDTSHLLTAQYLSGKTPHIPPEFQPDVCFFLLRFIEYGEIMADAVQSIWDEIGDERSYDRNVLLEDANRLVTLVGYIEQSPAAFLQYGTLPGWITLLCVAPACRNASIGTQLIGQAIMDTRMKGGDYIYIPLAPNNPHRDFFFRQGFSVVDELADGRDVFAKDIRCCAES